MTKENQTPEVQTSTAEQAAVEKKANAAIINGRMPVAIVAQVRFGANKTDTNKELATLYGTTVGKIDDIKKNRNFTYVTADFKPTAAMKEEGVAWLQRHPKFSTGAVDAIITELENTDEAAESDVAAFDAACTAARAQPTVTKEGEPVVDAGGGNRRKSRKAKVVEAKVVEAPVEVDQSATADALLA